MGQRNLMNPASFSLVKFINGAALAAAATLTLAYPQMVLGAVNPTLKNAGHFKNGSGHKLSTPQGDYLFPRDFELTFNAANITLTWRASTPLPASLLQGSPYILQLEENGHTPGVDGKGGTGNVTGAVGVGAYASGVFLLNLTSPATAAANNIALAQAIGGAVNAVLAGTLATGGVAYMDVPRGVQAVSANAGDTTQSITVFGTDVYGQAMRETIALNGTTIVNGKKAFWIITRIAVSAVMAGNLTVGTNTVLGLPVFLPAAGYIIKELQDGALATAGTTVAGAIVTPTATSADVRGTYVPNSAPDGSRQFQLVVFLGDAGQIGGPQFNG